MNLNIPERNCPLCEAPHPPIPWRITKDTFAYKYSVDPDVQYKLYKCDKCDMVFVSPLPEIVMTENLYRQSIIDYKSKTQSRHNRTFSIIRKLMPSGKILEVGSSYGAVLKMLADVGYDARGIEPDQDAAEFASAQGLNVRCGFTEEVVTKDENNLYDLIVADNVMEHVHEVQRLGQLLSQLLRVGGILLVIVPNLRDFRRFLVYGWEQKWLYHPVEHINYFTVFTLKKFFINAGLNPFIPRLSKLSPSLKWRAKEILEFFDISSWLIHGRYQTVINKCSA